MTTRLVVLGWGNPSRGDDALGPEFLARAEPLAQYAPCDALFVTDFQLQPEHSSDLLGRDLALFVDASTTAPAPFLFCAVAPTRDRTFTSHAMSPGALLTACADAFSSPLPAGFLLAIRGDRFELGDGISPAARANLGRAVAFFETLLQQASAERWSAVARERAAGRHAA
jgi:hydrogenase maturation protease